MRIKIYKKITSIIISVSLIISGTTTIFAGEHSEIPSITSLSTELQYEIEKLLEDYPSAELYITNVINSCIENSAKEDAESQIIEAVNGIRQCNSASNKRWMPQGAGNTDMSLNMAYAIAPTSYATALAAYKTGITIVQNKGCPQTAAYMEHAVVSESAASSPADYVHSYDSWANAVCYSPSFQAAVTTLFETQILGQSTGSGGTVTGSVVFDSSVDGLDLFAALHAVDFSVSFIWRTQGGYDTIYYVTDKYDFAYSADYENFEVGFANNYCYAMQSMGWIRPFNIIINNAHFR